MKALTKEFKTVFIFIDTDKHASPFDILATIDVLPEAAIIKYENVTVEDAEKIVYDAMFPRGPEGVKHTKIFINGRNFELTNEILEKIKKCMFPPFELSVVIDPRGAYTTASAAVAKTLEISIVKGLGGLEGKKVAVLAGTGPVGQTAARLYAFEKAKVIVTSRDLKRSMAVAEKINEEVKEDRAKGVEAKTPEEMGAAIKDAEIILAAGAAGVQLLPLNTLKEYGRSCRIVADINAIPPLGVEGLKPTWDGKEVIPNVFGVGALAIGVLKNAIEAKMIKMAAEEPKGIFDYKVAYQIARELISKKLEEGKGKSESGKHWLP
ncbi:MAG: methylenetetrahydromethanopterin dehydrogenase [Candidatus Bathyarchaeota archaeon]|nr:methylenetetrahydromethanopterin dehydrogenase [Candidatus Bathyarchaeota archaeon]MDW8040861.1 methylene-tetrahydromethanopterin dehydrogenase N-terminal domain-containing protein [Nitrososphaerota archaeon]